MVNLCAVWAMWLFVGGCCLSMDGLQTSLSQPHGACPAGGLRARLVVQSL